MKINVEFENVMEMQEFAKSIKCECNCGGTAAVIKPQISEDTKEEIKEESKGNSKKKASTTVKKADKAEDKKEEPPKVEAEVIGVDNAASAEPTKDAEATEDEGSQITKEMLRDLCATVMKSGKQAEVKKAFEKYGASKLPEVKPEDYTAVYKEVEALK